MKKCLVVLAVCIYSSFSIAQNVGVGVPNPQNKLHVGGGFRLDTLTGVGGAGIVWHNSNGVIYGTKFTGNTNDVLRGDGTFGPYNPAINGALGWLLTGNSGTSPATHFLGTIDDQPLSFRVNNIRHGFLSNYNIFFGSNAGLLNTSGKYNIAIGSGALANSTNRNKSIAIGDSALYNSATAPEGSTLFQAENVAIGYKALFANQLGLSNTAIGTGALQNSTASSNVAIGNNSLNKNTTGTTNIALGSLTLFSNTVGRDNIGIGYSTMSANVGGNQNVAIGTTALVNANGSNNVAVGYRAHAVGLGGSNNIAIGSNTLEFNSASANAGIGYLALSRNTLGTGNNAFGAHALQRNSTGGLNTAVGYAALQQNTDGYGNSAFGYLALTNSISSLGGNSAFGRVSLYNNQSGYNNTAFGEASLYNNISGINNTAIGELAGAALPSNVSNVTAIGYNTGWVTTLSNHINIGNFSVQWIGGQTGWFHYSDKRIKNDIKNDVPGLAFITRLKPITYHVDIDKQEEIANAGRIENNSELIKPVKKDWEAKYDVEKIKMTGFFAQDVEEAARAINYLFNGVYNPKNGGLLSLDYSAFVVPLVKAVQEQQAIIEKQQKQIDDLIKRIEALEKK